MAGYGSVSGGHHFLQCDPCLGWGRSQGCVERVLVLENHPMARLLMGKGSLTGQGRGGGKVLERELAKPTVDGGWVEIEGTLHSGTHVVKLG